MADPISIAVAAGSAAITGLGQYQQAQAKKASSKFNEQIDRRNQKIVAQQSEAAVADMASRHRRQLGSIRAAYGAANLELSGSPLDVLSDTATEQSLDIQKERYRARLKILGLEESAELNAMEADFAGDAGSIALLGGGFNVATAALKDDGVKNYLKRSN